MRVRGRNPRPDHCPGIGNRSVPTHLATTTFRRRCRHTEASMAIKHILATLLAVPAIALASFPDKPITFVHGFGAGGNADTVSRIVAEGLSKELGQPVVV